MAHGHHGCSRLATSQKRPGGINIMTTMFLGGGPAIRVAIRSAVHSALRSATRPLIRGSFRSTVRPAIRPTLVLAITVILSACGKPLPTEKIAYAGEWKGPQMSLLITQDGSVKYERLDAGASKSISGPLQGFEGHNFSVGIGPMSTTFVVAAPPHAMGDEVKMTVDGVELTKQE
jgi:hypothetical protein